MEKIMSSVEFTPWPKMGRLFRDVVITEKIDGTNAAILIKPLREVDHVSYEDESPNVFMDNDPVIYSDDDFVIFAQSRTRFITEEFDNYGFAKWVHNNGRNLALTLSTGRHFGEWWGNGIQRGYGLTKGEKRFSLFNTSLWQGHDLSLVENLDIVPVLYEGPFSTDVVLEQVEGLREFGSMAAPGYMNPEGVVTYMSSSNTCYKTTLVKDEIPKALIGK
jgi:hypothetical protein